MGDDVARVSAAEKPVRAAERAHAEIRSAIMNGDLPAGTMLSENELGGTLRMSRTPVRAALSRLQDEGWVTIYPQRGALVRELSEREVREAAEARHALESAGIRRARDDARATVADSLAENLQGQADALARGDLPAFTTLAMAFHRSFVELGGNSLMLEMYDRLQDRQFMSIRQSAGTISDDPHGVLAEHRALVDDARRGDWAAFAQHLDAHHDLES